MCFVQKSSLKTADMYSYYYMLNAIKKELVSGPKSRSDSDEGEAEDGQLMALKPRATEAAKSHSGRRKGSTASKKHSSLPPSDSECSLGDSTSTISSDSEMNPSCLSDEDEESEVEERVPTQMTSNANDVTEEHDVADPARLLFRHHLRGLHDVLKNLTDSAQHVTNKYQEEIGELSANGSNASQLTNFVL